MVLKITPLLLAGAGVEALNDLGDIGLSGLRLLFFTCTMETLESVDREGMVKEEGPLFSTISLLQGNTFQVSRDSVLVWQIGLWNCVYRYSGARYLRRFGCWWDSNIICSKLIIISTTMSFLDDSCWINSTCIIILVLVGRQFLKLLCAIP